MQDPPRIEAIVRAVSQSVSLPVTVKTRLGVSPDSCNISEVAHAAELGGAHALFLHARFATQHHSGPADWATVRRIRKERDIPIIGNGGISSFEQATHILRSTGIDGVMIGRAAIGNPWIFRAMAEGWAGDSCHPVTPDERLTTISEHLRGLHALIEEEERILGPRRGSSEQAACRRFRGHLARYLARRHGLRALLRRIDRIESIDALIRAAAQLVGASADQPGSSSYGGGEGI
jgi:tRNA-dihydrouridine synthase